MKIGQDSVASTVTKFASGVFAVETFRGDLEVEEFFDRGFLKVRLLGEGTILISDAPNPTVGMVAAGVAEVDFAVLNDGVIPVGNVDRAVGTHFDIDGAEGTVR